MLLGRLDEAWRTARTQGSARDMVAVVLAHDKITGASGPTKVAITDAKGDDLPSFLRKPWDPRVVQWVVGQNRLVSEAEMEAYAEALDPTAGKPAA